MIDDMGQFIGVILLIVLVGCPLLYTFTRVVARAIFRSLDERKNRDNGEANKE